MVDDQFRFLEGSRVILQVNVYEAFHSRYNQMVVRQEIEMFKSRDKGGTDRGEPDGIDGSEVGSQIPCAYYAFAGDAPYIAGRSLLELGRRVDTESAAHLGVETESVAVEGHESPFGAEYKPAVYYHDIIVMVGRQSVSAVVEIGSDHGQRFRIDGKTLQSAQTRIP